MTANYYDVVLIGTQLPSLLCGALLAKRGFRVLLLGHNDAPPTYRVEDLRLPRAPFTFLDAHSPVARRVLSELAIHQMFRRRATTLDPGLQIAVPGHRFDLPQEDTALEREIEREFPEVKRPVEDFHRGVVEISDEIDRLIERDIVWPPETFLERREFARAAGHLRFDRHGHGHDPLAELPEAHPFRTVADIPVRFSSDLDPDQRTPLGLTRLYGAWRRGPVAIEGGYRWLRRTLIDKIRTYTGEVRIKERAARILTRRGAACAVRLAGSEEEVGCSFVVCGEELSDVLRLVSDRAVFEEMFERLGEPQPRYFRYTLNVVVQAEGVPVGMSRDLFWVRDAHKPMCADNALHVVAHPADAQGRRLLCVEALLPRRGIEEVSGYREAVRERVLGSLREIVPFLDRHLLIVDSPHDGRDIQHVRRRALEPPAEPWRRGPKTMGAVYGFPVRGPLGVCALPVRTPVKRLLLCNRQVVPELGMEGGFLAAWSAARVVTKSDRRKEWMRRGLWTKVEL